jgi:hypothetical protein
VSHLVKVFACKLVTQKIIKGMGWNFTYLFSSIIKGHYPRPISLSCTLTELWPFFGLNTFFIIQALVYNYQAVRKVGHAVPWTALAID